MYNRLISSLPFDNEEGLLVRGWNTKNHGELFCFQSNSQYLTTWKWESVGEKAVWSFFFAAICCCCWEMTELIWLRESCFQPSELWLKQHTNHETNIGLHSITDVISAVQVTVSCRVQIHWGGGWGKEVKERERRWRKKRLNFITGLLLQ